MGQSHSKSNDVQRAAGVVGGVTALSRLMGFARDVATAYFLGAGFWSDAFFVAFRIPNLFRRLFGEGALTIAFVPMFSRVKREQGHDGAFKFFRSVFSLLLIFLIVLVLLGEVFAPQIVWLFASGFSTEKLQATTMLLRLLFPYILLISLVALSMGVLNSYKMFFTPAFAPVLLNIGMIGGLLISPLVNMGAAHCMGCGVIVGGVMQLAIQFRPLHKVQMPFDFDPKAIVAIPPEVKEILLLMIPSVFGAAAYQLNMLINTQLASHLMEGSISYLFYADRIAEFPLGIVAIALSTAILPYLSDQAAAGEIEALKKTFRDGLRSLYFLIIPAAVGLMMLREPIVSALFERKAFTALHAQHTAFALFFGAAGMVGVGTLRLVLPVFYSMKDLWTPFWISLVAIVINLVTALLFMGPLLHGGLALAVAIAAASNAAILIMILRKRIGNLGLVSLLGPVIRMLGAATVMAGILFWLGEWAKLYGWLDMGLLVKLLFVFGSIGFGAFAYFFCCYLFQLREVRQMGHLLRSKLGRS